MESVPEERWCYWGDYINNPTIRPYPNVVVKGQKKAFLGTNHPKIQTRELESPLGNLDTSTTRGSQRASSGELVLLGGSGVSIAAGGGHIYASETRVYTYGAAAARGAVAVRAAGSAGARVHFGGWRGKVRKLGRRLYKRWCANWRYSRRLSEPWLKRREEKRRGGEGELLLSFIPASTPTGAPPSLPLLPPSLFFSPLHHNHVPRQVGPRHNPVQPHAHPFPPSPLLELLRGVVAQPLVGRAMRVRARVGGGCILVNLSRSDGSMHAHPSGSKRRPSVGRRHG